MKVIFCKDCKHRWTLNCGCYYPVNRWLLNKDNDFCSRGEKEPYYIALTDSRIRMVIGYCDCSECKKRGSVEVSLANLDGLYCDSIPLNKISPSNLLYFGKSLTKAVGAYIEYWQNTKGAFEEFSKYMKELQKTE